MKALLLLYAIFAVFFYRFSIVPEMTFRCHLMSISQCINPIVKFEKITMQNVVL